MKNKHYKVKDEGSGGDCFFYVIVSAFKYIGKETSIFKLRHLLASKATEEIYLNYKELYKIYNKLISISSITNKNNSLYRTRTIY